MAKQNPTGNERSKVRLFYVEGEFAPGELRELTQAFSNAVRPTQVITRGPAPARLSPPAGDGNGSGEIAEAEIESVEEFLPNASDAPAPAKRGTRQRTYRKPEAVDDLDMNAGDKSWREFAAEKATAESSHRTKYLVAATWLHDHAKLPTITANHVFTCYKAAGWNFDIGDTTVTFRQLKGEQLGKLNRGQFSINHLGIAEVNDMKATA